MPPLSRSSCGDSPPGKVLGDEVAAPGKKLGVSERGRSVGSLCIRCLVSMQSSGCPSSYTSSRDYGVGPRNNTAKVMSLCWEGIGCGDGRDSEGRNTVVEVTAQKMQVPQQA